MSNWKDVEPFVTMRAFPRRFAWGIPIVFVGSIALGLALADVNLSLAIAVQLFIQTVGLLGLYMPAARDLRVQERAKWEQHQSAARADGVNGGDDTAQSASDEVDARSEAPQVGPTTSKSDPPAKTADGD